LLGSDFDEVSAAWGLGAGEVVEPDETVDSDSIRLAYAAASAGGEDR
jgi:hypothetical protein